MSYSQIVTNPLQQAILAILLVSAGFSTGYTTSDQHNTFVLEDQLKDFDQFSYKAQEVNAMMLDVLENPTEDSLKMVNNRLKINYANWEHREYGDNKELFHKYRLACQDVIDNLQENGVADTTEMETIYSELVPSSKKSNEHRININAPFIFVSGFPTIQA